MSIILSNCRKRIIVKYVNAYPSLIALLRRRIFINIFHGLVRIYNPLLFFPAAVCHLHSTCHMLPDSLLALLSD